MDFIFRFTNSGYSDVFYSHEPVAAPPLSSTYNVFFSEGNCSRRKKFLVELAQGCWALRLSSQISLHFISHCKSKIYTQKYKKEGCVWARNKPFWSVQNPYGWHGFWAGTVPFWYQFRWFHVTVFTYVKVWSAHTLKKLLISALPQHSCFSNEGRLRSGTSSCHWLLALISTVAIFLPSSCANTDQWKKKLEGKKLI